MYVVVMLVLAAVAVGGYYLMTRPKEVTREKVEQAIEKLDLDYDVDQAMDQPELAQVIVKAAEEVVKGKTILTEEQIAGGASV